ncbi:MAG TPA: hypothetical protein VFK33_04835 [Bacillales bacterium]|nr:hypothetical protein [Bacillales bacterium]
MKKRSQAEAIRNMPDRVLILNLYFTQLLLAVAAFVMGWFLFGSWESFYRLFQWRPVSIFLLGGGLAAFVILLDMILMKGLPRRLV